MIKKIILFSLLFGFSTDLFCMCRVVDRSFKSPSTVDVGAPAISYFIRALENNSKLLMGEPELVRIALRLLAADAFGLQEDAFSKLFFVDGRLDYSLYKYKIDLYVERIIPLFNIVARKVYNVVSEENIARVLRGVVIVDEEVIPIVEYASYRLDKFDLGSLEVEPGER